MRLIDADALLDYAWDADTRCGYVEVVDVGTIEEAPTIDPVKHGKWNCYYDEDFDSEVIECSKCGERFFTVFDDTEYFMTNYCPNCGARMDGEQE